MSGSSSRPKSGGDQLPLSRKKSARAMAKVNMVGSRNSISGRCRALTPRADPLASPTRAQMAGGKGSRPSSRGSNSRPGSRGSDRSDSGGAAERPQSRGASSEASYGVSEFNEVDDGDGDSSDDGSDTDSDDDIEFQPKQVPAKGFNKKGFITYCFFLGLFCYNTVADGSSIFFFADFARNLVSKDDFFRIVSLYI